MSEQPASRPFLTLVSAILLGLVGDALIRGVPWGINVVLGIALLGGLLIHLLVKTRPETLASAIPAIAAATLMAALVAWHDSPALIAIDLLCTLLLLGLAGFGARQIRLVSSGLLRSALAILVTALQTAVGPLQLILGDIPWRTLPIGRTGRLGFGVLRGLLIAIPALLLFGALLISADEAFAGLIKQIFDIDVPLLLQHAFFFCAIAAVSAGYLRSLSVGEPLPAGIERPSFFTLGFVESLVIIGTIDLLFASFVIVQIRYFFGGAALVRVAPGLTYSQYARHGFFELATVAGLVVPLLLAVDWIAEKENSTGTRALRAASGLMIALVFVMIASALQRMRLYQREYGMTELRFYTVAFMFWLAALLLWLVLTVLRGRRERFTIGAVLSAVVAVVVLNLLDPDATIVRANFERAAANRKPVDSQYAGRLSADAVPTIVQHFDSLPNDEKKVIAARLVRRFDAERTRGWLTWNVSRAAAVRALAPRIGELRALAKR